MAPNQRQIMKKTQRKVFPLLLLTLIISACSPAAPTAPAEPSANTEAAGDTVATEAATEAPTATAEPTSLVIAPETLGQLRFFWNAEFPGDPDADGDCGSYGEACTHRSRISDYVFSADGNTLAVGVCLGIRTTDWYKKDGDVWGCTADSVIILYDSATGEELGRLTPAALPLSLAFHPHGTILAAGLATSDIEIWDVESGELTSTLPGPVKFTGAYPVAFALDGERLITGSGPGQITDNAVTGRRVVGAEINVWDWSAAELVTTIARVVGVGISPDGTKLVTNTVGNFDGPLGDTVRIYDLTQVDQFAELPPVGQLLPELIYFNPRNGWIGAVEEYALLVSFLDPNTFELMASLNSDEEVDETGMFYDLNSGGFTPDGYFVLNRIGELLSPEAQPEATGLDEILWECGFALADVEKNQVLYASNPMLYDECINPPYMFLNIVYAPLILSPDGRFIAGDQGRGSLRIWGIDPSQPAVEPSCYGDC